MKKWLIISFLLLISFFVIGALTYSPFPNIDIIKLKGLDIQDGDINNVGQIKCDGVSADAGSFVLGNGNDSLAINTYGWDITKIGDVSGLGNIDAVYLHTADSIATVYIDAVYLHTADSIATVYFTGDSIMIAKINAKAKNLILGADSDSIAINSYSWDIAKTGNASGLGNVDAVYLTSDSIQIGGGTNITKIESGQASFATNGTSLDTLVISGLSSSSCFLVTSINKWDRAATAPSSPAAIGVYLVTDTAFVSIAAADTNLCDSYNWLWVK